MFNPTQVVITAFIRELRAMYDRTYGTLEPGFPGVISLSPSSLWRISRPATHHITTLITPFW
jgi:hypothetical protein